MEEGDLILAVNTSANKKKDFPLVENSLRKRKLMQNMFSFSFNYNDEQDRIIEKHLWSFNGFLIVTKIWPPIRSGTNWIDTNLF